MWRYLFESIAESLAIVELLLTDFTACSACSFNLLPGLSSVVFV